MADKADKKAKKATEDLPIDLLSVKFLREDEKQISWDDYLKEHKKAQSKAHVFEVWTKATGMGIGMPSWGFFVPTPLGCVDFEEVDLGPCDREEGARWNIWTIKAAKKAIQKKLQENGEVYFIAQVDEGTSKVLCEDSDLFLTIDLDDDEEDIGRFTTRGIGAALLDGLNHRRGASPALTQPPLFSPAALHQHLDAARKERGRTSAKYHPQPFLEFPRLGLLPVASCRRLCEYLDLVHSLLKRAVPTSPSLPPLPLTTLYQSAHLNKFDLKLTLSRESLTELIGLAAVQNLFAFFKSVNEEGVEIRLRRVEGGRRRSDPPAPLQKPARSIGFHLDYSLRTMSVALNHAAPGPAQGCYTGGRLVFISQQPGDTQPHLSLACGGVRQAGSVTIHDNTIVHGVTPVLSGTRYSLFLLQQEP